MSTFVIAISGSSGAGKTTLVRQLVSLLADAVAIHFDDYQPVAKYPTDMVQWVSEGKDLDAWQIPQLVEDLKALRSGNGVTLPGNKGMLMPAKFVILEEPSGRIRAGLRELIDFVVFLDLPLDIALARKVVEYFGYCVKELPADELQKAAQIGIDYFAKYPVHREYYLLLSERGRQDCDLILDGTQSTAHIAEKIITAIKPFTML